MDLAYAVFKPIGPLDGRCGGVPDFPSEGFKSDALPLAGAKTIRPLHLVLVRRVEDCASGHLRIWNIVQGEYRYASATWNWCADCTAKFWHAGDPDSLPGELSSREQSTSGCEERMQLIWMSRQTSVKSFIALAFTPWLSHIPVEKRRSTMQASSDKS